MRTYLTLSLLLLAQMAIAQSKFTISGTIKEQSSGELLPGVLVADVKTKQGTYSNNYGFYTITLDSDSANLIFHFLGYNPFAYKAKLTKNVVLNVDLVPESIEMKEVVISAEQQRKISEETQMSTIDIPVDQIKKIPALFGEKDVLKVIQLLPGVQKGSEGQSGFYVRGGGPDQNLIILDDATVYNVSHLFGFFSLFNGDALKSVELMKGGFPARYGGRLSSVLEMQMKDGDKNKLHGEAGIGLIASRLTLEGPIKKGKSSFLVSGRRTYIDALIYPFLPKDNRGGYFFYDFNAKVNFELNERNRLFVSGYFGKDKFYLNTKFGDSKSTANLLWGNTTATARWNHIINEKTFANTSLIFSNYRLVLGVTDQFQGFDFSLRYSSAIRDWSGKFDVDYRPNTNHAIRTGAMLTWHRFTPSAVVIKGSDFGDELNSTNSIDGFEGGAYIEDDWRINNRWKANIGFRVSQFTTLGKTYVNPEPRASVRFKIDENMSLKGSYAMMNQYLHLLSNTGTGLPTDLWVPATNNVRPQRSQQWALGLARDIEKPQLTVTLEGYYKDMHNILGYKEGASFLVIDDPNNSSKVEWERNVTSGQGKSYGAELMVQKKFGKFTGWVGYTLSWTKLQFDSLNNGESYFARFDRRHDASLVLMYDINDAWRVSATWVYGTGQAITLPLSTYLVDVQRPGSTTNGFQNFVQVNNYGPKNSFRMEAYHRMDIAFQHTKQMKRCTKVFEVGLYNAYNRMNPYFYYTEQELTNNSYRTVLKKVTIFPVLPSVSWTYKF